MRASEFIKQGVAEDTLNEFSAFHGTFRPTISRFKPLSHFGTERAATERLNAVKSTTPSLSNADTGYIYQLDLGITAPGVVKDYYDIVDPGPSSMKKIAAWSKDLLKDTRFAAYTGKNPINGKPNDDGKHILQHFARMADSGYWAEYYPYTKFISIWINFLQDAGVDGLVYSNQVENPGSKSYITFNPGQIKIIGKPKLVNLQSSEDNKGVAEGLLQEISTVPTEKIFLLVKNIHGRKNDFDEGDIYDRIYWFDDYKLDRLPISKINLHQWDVDERYVDELVDNITNKKQKIRPIIFDPIQNSIIDGTHRANAYAKLGYKYIPAYIGHTKSNSYGQREDDELDEMAMSTYKTMGDFSKPGPFTGADKKLVPHPKNIEKATRFFEQTPYDFRLFFSHLKGTGKWSEHGVMSPDQIRQIFGKDAEEIINGSQDAITIVFVGNKGDAKVMLTPWMMAHRFGHAIQSSGQPLAKNKIASNWEIWLDTSNHFFTTVNDLLEEYYGKINQAMRTTGIRDMPAYGLTAEYNALFNAIGTQRSSRSGQIRRPYEFLYELFAQYLGTGKVTLNPLPTNLGYGRKAWGNPTKYMNIKPEYRDEAERKHVAERLAYDMELMFNDVLSSSVGKIYVM